MSRKFDALEARKELLAMKAQLERMELGMQVQDLRHSMTWLPAVQRAGEWLGQRDFSSFGAALGPSLGPLKFLFNPMLKKVLGAYPILSALASTALLNKFKTPLASAGARAGVAAVVLAAAAYWYQKRSPKASKNL